MLAATEVAQGYDINALTVLALLAVGFVGGLVSGFIGSGGAFVLTPAMMSLGVPGLVAVASNMCHKFPKAMVGAYKRLKYGQVDLRLGIIMAASATGGVQVGIVVQELIRKRWGEAGSNLYISLAFIAVLVTVGGYVFRDAWKIARTGGWKRTSRLARALSRINLPPMIQFKGTGLRISLWFTVPIGFATGFCAATIAVGGFVGVPGMIYVIGTPGLVASATELVVAFFMGMGGSIKWAMAGMIDIRLTLIILAGSLFGVQVGAIGTTYVKDHMIKVVMGTIMLIVAASRAMALPDYLVQLDVISMSPKAVSILILASKVSMGIGLLVGAVIILGAMLKGRKAMPPSTNS